MIFGSTNVNTLTEDPTMELVLYAVVIVKIGVDVIKWVFKS
jgi:hypothetical protein